MDLEQRVRDYILNNSYVCREKFIDYPGTRLNKKHRNRLFRELNEIFSKLEKERKIFKEPNWLTVWGSSRAKYGNFKPKMWRTKR